MRWLRPAGGRHSWDSRNALIAAPSATIARRGQEIVLDTLQGDPGIGDLGWVGDVNGLPESSATLAEFWIAATATPASVAATPSDGAIRCILDCL